MRILWISDSPLAFSGYGTVTREVLGRLSRLGHEVACIGWSYQGWPYDRETIPYTIYPSDPRLFGRDVAARAIGEFLPDVVVAFGDLWAIDWVKELRLPHPYKLVVYFPVDGKRFPQASTAVLRAADAAVAYSLFGQREVALACPDVPVDLIYHGIDLETFRPLGDKSALQAERGVGGKFVVGCVARNQPRKQFPVLLKAFARFAAECEEAILYLHTDPRDFIGWDLIALAQSYGLEGRTAFSVSVGTILGVAPEELNRIYNAMDVLVLPTMGEGFGLPIAEAMAAGVPVIATRCSACEELLEGRGELIDVEAYVAVGRHAIEHALPAADDLLAKLRLLRADAERRARHIAAGLAFVPQLGWDVIMPQWQALLGRMA
ncbi:MAG TPA: glycosyltransferase family 4 protein [Thermoanaerobaculia bacterium]|nr:glycosyltransferase family 4 protein [Thermoanaerobaculia bacterium]